MTADGQKYVRTRFVKFGVLEIVRYIRRKEACHKAVHSTVGEGEKSTKSTSVRKKAPLVPRYIIYHEI